MNPELYCFLKYKREIISSLHISVLKCLHFQRRSWNCFISANAQSQATWKKAVKRRSWNQCTCVSSLTRMLCLLLTPICSLFIQPSPHSHHRPTSISCAALSQQIGQGKPFLSCASKQGLTTELGTFSGTCPVTQIVHESMSP